MIDYVSYNLQLLKIGKDTISHECIEFHENVIKAMVGEEAGVKRLGARQTTPVTSVEYLYNPTALVGKVREELFEIVKVRKKIDVTLFDLSANSSTDVRDTIFVVLSEITKELVEYGCCNFIFLLRQIPGEAGMGLSVYKSVVEKFKDKDLRIDFISASGSFKRLVSGKGEEVSANDGMLREIFEKYYESPLQRLKNKTVRRLGHFTTRGYGEKARGCRKYSYFTLNVEKELLRLIEDWWTERKITSEAIVFDSPNNQYLRDSINAFATKYSLLCERYEDVLVNGGIQASIRAKNKATVVVDVVESGVRVKEIFHKLQVLGIECCREVVCVINKGGKNVTELEDVNITGFLRREREVYDAECEQCKCGLPFTSEVDEAYIKLRDYEILHMIELSGWEEEPINEVPVCGERYLSVPNFIKMLEQHGDWIAYKYSLLINSLNKPYDWFFLHPDQAAAGMLSSLIQNYLPTKKTVVKIPKVIIDAQIKSDVIEGAIETGTNEEWELQLQSLRGSGALIMDIYNASGSTKLAMGRVLERYDITPFAYFSFIDFDPNGSKGGPYEVKSLYDWYNPRDSRGILG